MMTVKKNDTESILSMEGLSHIYRQRNKFSSALPLYAVNNINITLNKGTTLGLVGESGCGKSTLARIACGLLPPEEGVVRIHGSSLYNKIAHKDYTKFRQAVRHTVQMVFQDTQSSLNPRMRVKDSVAEPLICLMSNLSPKERTYQVHEILDQVGIDPASANRYPHEFSGGQRQRIAIARALIIHPQLVICDEPTSSLDSSVQAQVLNLLMDMQDAHNLSYLFISHDLAVIHHMSDSVAVMYAGSIVEQAPTEIIFSRPLHPYTQLLFSSAMTESTGKEIVAPSYPTAKHDYKNNGCLFAHKCSLVEPVCKKVFPPLMLSPCSVEGPTAHLVRCPIVLKNRENNCY